MAFTDTEPRTAQQAGRTVARCGWGILVAVGAVLALHGVGQYILVATTPGGRATGILLGGVGLMALMAALDGLRHGSRWAWNTTWFVVAVLAALGAHILLGGMRELDGRHLALGAAALTGQILAAADRSPATAEQLSLGRQLRAAYPIGFAYAAGVFGALSYLQLLGFYVVEFGLPQSGGPLGSANDLTSAPTGVVMVPVALALRTAWPPGRARVLLTLTGVVAMIAPAVAGPLLVYGVIDFFPTQLVIGAGAAALLVGWIALTSRALGRSASWSAPAKLGRALGVGYVAALGILAAGAVVPSSLAQQIVLGIGFALGGLVWLAVPLWFFLVGACLATAGLPTQAEPDLAS